MDKNTEFKAFLSKFKEANPVLMETVEKGFVALFESSHPNITKLQINIETGNDAFHDDWNGEVAKILRDLANRIQNEDIPTKLMDSNGNYVGNMRVG